jgi:hypothetical protein
VRKRISEIGKNIRAIRALSPDQPPVIDSHLL